jgi:hypothetical protein
MDRITSTEVKEPGRRRSRVMKTGTRLLIVVAVALLLLALTIPLQYLVRSEVVVGLSPESAHSHAHGTEEESQGSEEGHVHEGEEAAPEFAIGVNLIPNYGFEVGTYEQIWGWSTRPDNQGAVLYRDDGISHRGLASAAVSTNGLDVVDAGWLARLPVLPLEHDVVFEGYIKTEGLQGGSFLRVIAVTEVDGEMHVLFWATSDPVGGDSDWVSRSIRCSIPAETTAVWLEIGLDGNGRAWFDDVSLVVEESTEDGNGGG